MNTTIFEVFGESTCNPTDSKYSYANVLTLDIMEKLIGDDRFGNCTQSDIINLALVMLYGFFAPEEHNRVSKAKLHEFVEDLKEFKDFSIVAMNVCRRKNVALNEAICEMKAQED